MKSPKPQKPSPNPHSPVVTGRPPAVGSDFAPVPRRISRPRWLDPRLIGGLVLVIASVVVGARVIGASSHTSPVWVAAHDLTAGTVLTAADVRAVDVNLGDNADRYLLADPAKNAVSGRALNGSLKAGEFVPISALSAPESGRIIVIGVTADRMPPGVGHGSKIDLYLTESSATGGKTSTSLISSAITVQSVTAPASGGLSGASSNRYQVAVLLDAVTADKLVRTLPSGDPIVVLVSGG